MGTGFHIAYVLTFKKYIIDTTTCYSSMWYFQVSLNFKKTLIRLDFGVNVENKKKSSVDCLDMYA